MKRTGDLALQELHKRFPAALDYLTSIFLIDRDYGQVANSRIATRLGVSKPAVSQAVGRLKRRHLADQDSYGTIRLTPEGRIFAARILKRHYLIEHLLIRRLDYPWASAIMIFSIASLFKNEAAGRTLELMLHIGGGILVAGFGLLFLAGSL